MGKQPTPSLDLSVVYSSPAACRNLFKLHLYVRIIAYPCVNDAAMPPDNTTTPPADGHGNHRRSPLTRLGRDREFWREFSGRECHHSRRKRFISWPSDLAHS